MTPDCGLTSPGPIVVVCDRPRGHDGPCRGYLEQQDAVLFWTATAIVARVDRDASGRRLILSAPAVGKLFELMELLSDETDRRKSAADQAEK